MYINMAEQKTEQPLQCLYCAFQIQIPWDETEDDSRSHYSHILKPNGQTGFCQGAITCKLEQYAAMTDNVPNPKARSSVISLDRSTWGVWECRKPKTWRNHRVMICIFFTKTKKRQDVVLLMCGYWITIYSFLQRLQRSEQKRSLTWSPVQELDRLGMP